MPVSNGAIREAKIGPLSETKKLVTVYKISGDGKYSQNIIFKSGNDQPVVLQVVRENSFLKISDYGNTISFEVDSALAESTSNNIQIQLFGRDTVSAAFEP